MGSNLEQPKLQIRTAIENLDREAGIDVIADAGYFSSKPMGPEDQPDYINSVVKLETRLTVETLLERCQAIELSQGRVRARHWGERTIDLDILLYGDMQRDDESLTIPHAGLCERDFVYLPLLKLAPDIVIPSKGRLRDIVASGGKCSDFACQFVGNIE